MFALTVNAEGGADAERLVRDHPLTRDVASSSMDAVLLAGFAAYWRLSQLPEPPALAGARAHQRAIADATLRWLRCRETGRLGGLSFPDAG
jgi:hypothetical protein